MATKTEMKEIVFVKNNQGEEKPWEIVLQGVGTLDKARTMLNHPSRRFENRSEALKEGEEIRTLLNTDVLLYEGDDGLIYDRFSRAVAHDLREWTDLNLDSEGNIKPEEIRQSGIDTGILNNSPEKGGERFN